MSEPKHGRFIMIGGFLGAGKTTAIERFASRLINKGFKVGLITNDQAGGLVDSQVLKNKGYLVEEIAGGCFCCRFNTLREATEKLTRESTPDFFLAEPVGSCTDLVATVSYPLRRMYGHQYTIAPLSVMIDPQRAIRLLGFTPGKTFSKKVRYIYKKQLEEAEVIVINKSDTFDESRLFTLTEQLYEMFPGKKIFHVSARFDIELNHWFNWITQNEMQLKQAPDIDYDTYAEGESKLGWLNASIHLDSSFPFQAREILTLLAQAIKEYIIKDQGDIAHLKMTLSPAEHSHELASIHLTDNEEIPELNLDFNEPIHQGWLTINCRAECHPDKLQQGLIASLQRLQHVASLSTKLIHSDHFCPARPVPTYRDASLSS